MAEKQIDTNYWQEQIEAAESLQKEQHKSWKEALYFVEGTWFEKNYGLILPTGDETPVNYATAFLRTLIPAIYSRDPYIFVRAEHSRYSGFAESMERVLNYLWRELELKTQIKKATIDAVVCGLGWIETGFEADFESLNVDEDSEDKSFAKKVKDFIAGRKPELEKSPEESGILYELIKRQSAYAQRVSPYKVKLAPGYHDIGHMPYLIVAEDIHPIDFKKRQIYRHKSEIKPTRAINTSEKLVKSTNRPTPTQTKDSMMMIRLYHIWDRRNRRRFVMAEGSQEVLARTKKWPYSFEGFSQVPLIFNEVPETDTKANAYPISDITPMIPQLKELYLLRTAMVRHRKRSGTLIVVRKNALTEEQKRNIQTGDDVAIIEVDDERGILNYAPPALPADIYNINNIILDDLDRVGGLSQLLQVMRTPAKTATEASIQAGGSQIRMSEKVDVIEKFTMDIARRLGAIAWELYPKQKIAEILGEPRLNNSMWPELPEDPEERIQMIQAELKFKIDAGSTRPPKDKAIEREQKLRLVNILKQGWPGRIKDEIILKQLLKDFDFRDIDAAIIGEDQEEGQVATQENELLLKNIPQLVSPNELHEVHLPIHAQAAKQNSRPAPQMEGEKAQKDAPPQGSTPALDQHILDHNDYLQKKLPGGSPQKGDQTTGAGGVSPEDMRKGMPAEADMIGALSQMNREPGAEKGGGV